MLDWDDLRFFLAIARHGSLMAAAKDLHVAHSTTGRRLASLEASLNVRLLNRTPNGYVLTLAGREIMKYAERLETEALSLQRNVSGRDTRLAGLVRVTSTEAVATQILAPCVAVLHREYPDLMIELLPSSREFSLSMREADISLNLSKPEGHDLVVRRIGELGFGLYASPSYLQKHGGLDFEAGCAGHHLITQFDDIESVAHAEWLTGVAPRARVAVQTCSHEAAVIAALHGGGIACLARFRADRETGLARLATPTATPHTPIWQVVHRDNRANARIRVVLNHVSQSVRELAGQLLPKDEGAVASDENRTEAT